MESSYEQEKKNLLDQLQKTKNEVASLENEKKLIL